MKVINILCGKKILTWLKVKTSERNRVRSPLSEWIEDGTLGTIIPPGNTKSLLNLWSITINLESDGPALHADNRRSVVRSYPYPITRTALSATDCGSIFLILPIFVQLLLDNNWLLFDQSIYMGRWWKMKELKKISKV